MTLRASFWLCVRSGLWEASEAALVAGLWGVGREGPTGQSLRGWWECGVGDSGWKRGGLVGALLPSSG